MGFFKRKDSKTNTPEHQESVYSPTGRVTHSSDKLSDYSLKSPKLVTTVTSIHNTMATSTSDIEIPKPPDPEVNPAAYLRSIHAVRERSKFVLDKAKANRLNHFDVDMSKFQDTADYVVSIIKVRNTVHIPTMETLTDNTARLCKRISTNTSTW